MPGSCYVCCRAQLAISLALLVVRAVGRREVALCDQCADDLRRAPRLFWDMAGVELLAVCR